MVHPIIDQFYSRSPYHIRSSAYVQAQGLTSNEKRPIPSQTPDPTTSQHFHDPLAAGVNPYASLRHGQPFRTSSGGIHLGPIIPIIKPARSPECLPRSCSQLHNVFPPQNNGFGNTKMKVKQSFSQPPSRDASPEDLRSVSSTPAQGTSMSKSPAAQGNIKVKRRSSAGLLSTDVQNHRSEARNFVGTSNSGSAVGSDTLNRPNSPDLSRDSGGNPDKIAQFFPELRRYS